MKSYQEKFISIAIQEQALQFGDFTLKSGRQSPYFFNAANMLSAKCIFEVAQCYLECINDNNLSFDCMFGPAYKGIFLGSAIAALMGQSESTISLAFNRKEVKDHGEGGNIIGQIEGAVLIIDDVLSAGTAAKEAINTVEQSGTQPAKYVLVGLDRQEKGQGELSARTELESQFDIKVLSIISLDTLIDYIDSDRTLDASLSAMRDYRQVWGA